MSILVFCVHAELFEVDAKQIISLTAEEKKRLFDLVRMKLTVYLT